MLLLFDAPLLLLLLLPSIEGDSELPPADVPAAAAADEDGPSLASEGWEPVPDAAPPVELPCPRRRLSPSLIVSVCCSCVVSSSVLWCLPRPARCLFADASNAEASISLSISLAALYARCECVVLLSMGRSPSHACRHPHPSTVDTRASGKQRRETGYRQVSMHDISKAHRIVKAIAWFKSHAPPRWTGYDAAWLSIAGLTQQNRQTVSCMSL